MALRRLLQVFSTMMVKTYDLDWLRDVISDQLLTRMTDLASAKGVVTGQGNTLEVYADGTDIKVKTGAAWIAGERVQVESVQTIAGGADDTYYILITHTNEADSDAHATRLDDLGDPHTVWYRDGYTLIKTTNGSESEDPTKLLLAQAVVSGGTVTVTDMRTYVTVSLPLAAESVITGWLANLAVTYAKIANRAVSGIKIALNGVLEENMAPNTDLVPLLVDRQDEPVAGDKVTPDSHVIYYAATGGVYEYKTFGRVLFEDQRGPIRRLRLKCLLGSPGSGSCAVALVAWTDTPASYDPEDPSYDGLVDIEEFTNPGPDTPVELEIDLTSLSDPADGILKYGLVLRNSTDQPCGVFDVVLVGVR